MVLRRIQQLENTCLQIGKQIQKRTLIPTSFLCHLGRQSNRQRAFDGLSKRPVARDHAAQKPRLQKSRCRITFVVVRWLRTQGMINMTLKSEQGFSVGHVRPVHITEPRHPRGNRQTVSKSLLCPARGKITAKSKLILAWIPTQLTAAFLFSS